MKFREFEIKATSISMQFLCLMLFFSFLNSSAAGGDAPEYMKIDYGKVPALEIKGSWDTSGVFIASDLEELPLERRPKLRGLLQGVDLENPSIRLYGLNIKVDEETQFLDTGQGKFGLKDLEVNHWIEVSCKINEDSSWEARKIKIKDIKEENKIKGTVTRFHIDGKSPDTLEIHGLIIILNEKTDVNYPGSSFQDTEDELFKGVELAGPASSPVGVVAGDRVLMNIELRETTRNEIEYDLTNALQSNESESEPELRLELTGYADDHFLAYGQLRMRGTVLVNSQRNNPPKEKLRTNITQLYLLARNVGLDGLTVQAGRQDFDEPREWLYDEYLDAARIYYYGKPPLIFEAAYIHSDFEIKQKFRTWTDLFAQIMWRFDKHNIIRAYRLSRKDTDETRNREPVWWGAGFWGRTGRHFRPWLEMAIMRGQDKGNRLKASALDIGTTAIFFDLKYSPSVTMGYAVGTGDKTGGDGISNEFRQTGYEDNTGYFGGVRTFQYYGELVDPELSNIQILTLGAGCRPFATGSFEIVYHKYDQNRPDDKLRGALVDPPARPNGVDTDLGKSVDFVFGVSKLWNRVYLGWVFGIFYPGNAFSPFLKRATFNKFNMKITL